VFVNLWRDKRDLQEGSLAGNEHAGVIIIIISSRGGKISCPTNASLNSKYVKL
jgi:hypothetical protein